MVKQSKKPSGPRRGPMPDINADGTPRKRPGLKPKPESAKSDRIIMRVHPDLLTVIDRRAEERGMGRSQYLRNVIVGWSNADPRNPRLGLSGKQIDGAPPPGDMQRHRPHVFAERWQRFVAAHTAVMGYPPPTGWVEELDDRNVVLTSENWGKKDSSLE